MSKVYTVRHGGLKALYSVERPLPIDGVSLPGLKHYRQQDYYTCGYLAALTVVEYFRPKVDPKELLSIVQPIEGVGTERDNIVEGLNHFGISVLYKDDLTIPMLHLCVELGVPVIISVWPDGWVSDHWTIVRGFSGRYAYLTNHYAMNMGMFQREWIDNWEDTDTGAGLVCYLK